MLFTQIGYKKMQNILLILQYRTLKSTVVAATLPLLFTLASGHPGLEIKILYST